MSTRPGDSPNGHPRRASNPRRTRRVNVVGKGGHVRTVPIPIWVKSKVDAWLAAAAITRGPERKKGKKDVYYRCTGFKGKCGGGPGVEACRSTNHVQKR